jgi:hypothetical protein
VAGDKNIIVDKQADEKKTDRKKKTDDSQSQTHPSSNFSTSRFFLYKSSKDAMINSILSCTEERRDDFSQKDRVRFYCCIALRVSIGQRKIDIFDSFH